MLLALLPYVRKDLTVRIWMLEVALCWVSGFFFFLGSTIGNETTGLNSLLLERMFLRSDSSFFWGMNGRFAYLSIALVGSFGLDFSESLDEVSPVFACFAVL